MPTRSKAAILVEPNAPLVVDDVTFPDPQPDHVLIKLFASGICHSQLHQIHRTPQTAHRGTPAVYPALLGHEATGMVVATGHQVTHVREGDHVMTTWVDRGAVEGAPPRGPNTPCSRNAWWCLWTRRWRRMSRRLSAVRCSPAPG